MDLEEVLMNTADFDEIDLQVLPLSWAMIEVLTEDLQSRFPGERLKSAVLNQIYHAAKLSFPRLLVTCLNEIQNKELVKYLINIKYDELDGQEVTPLTIAAIQNNVAFVKTLLSHYDVDIEKECNVMFDGLLVYGATALWVAAGMGHMQIVKMLVQKGADVNHNTKAHSSPLRAACYEGRLDIVLYLIEHGADVNLANAYNNTSIMIAAYKGHFHIVNALLKNGANPNDQALCGATALHYAAECGHLAVCVLLLDHGARLLKNENGLTPVLLAAERVHDVVVRMFITQPGLMKKEEIITALELLGASYANDKDHYNVATAYQILMEAMQLRYSNPNNIIRKKVLAPVPAYDNWFETENIAELKAIRLNHHSMHMEALTVRERILGKHNEILVQPIIYRGAIMADQGRYAQCQALWSYAMDLRMINNQTVEAELQRFVQLFTQIMRTDMNLLDLSFVLSVLVRCQQEIENNRYKIKHPGPKDVPRLLYDHNELNVVTALHLIKIIAKKITQKSDQLDKSQIELLYATIYKFIKTDTRIKNSGQTMLHLACNNITPFEDLYTGEICRFPCYRTALILVHVGAPVNAVDKNRMTPLHTLVESFNKGDNTEFSLSEGEKIVKLLVEAGAHLDSVNRWDQTPAQIANIPRITNMIVNKQNSQSSLKCLAARSIAVNNLVYEGLIPVTLESFIRMHKAEKFESIY